MSIYTYITQNNQNDQIASFYKSTFSSVIHEWFNQDSHITAHACRCPYKMQILYIFLLRSTFIQKTYPRTTLVHTHSLPIHTRARTHARTPVS